MQEEPRVLPARVPNLLVNGSSGIAVGIATRIPPHNLREVVSGLHALIDKPDITIPELMEHIPAPDFPTGEHPKSLLLHYWHSGLPLSAIILDMQTLYGKVLRLRILLETISERELSPRCSKVGGVMVTGRD